MTNAGGRANEPTSYELRPPHVPHAAHPPVPAPRPRGGGAEPQAQAPAVSGTTAAHAHAAPGDGYPPAAAHPPVTGPGGAAAPAHGAAPGGQPGAAHGGEHIGEHGAGRLIGGRYRLLGRLGHGGMGTVWRAHDEVVDRHVAVKEPRVPDHLGAGERDKVHLRMQREARAAARIDHPSVVTVHDVVVEDGRPWIVMELIQGQSLAARLRDGTLDVREAARTGLAVLGALTAAHDAGVLHRDVKPDNVLLGRGGRVVLTDFGIAQVEGEQGLTETGGFVGSPEFIAPERVLGRHPGPESDLWSLGVVLYAAVEGVSPYRRSNAPATLQAVLSAEPQLPARGTGAFGTLVMQLLRKEPAMRPDPAEIRRVLESVAAPPAVYEPVRTAPGPTGAPGPATGAGRWVPPVLRESRAVRFGLGGGLLAVAAVAGLLAADPFGGDSGGLPAGWEVRNDREVVAAGIAVPSDYRRSQDGTADRVTYSDPSGVFGIELERVDRAQDDDELPPERAAWQRHYESGGKDGREIEDQKVTVVASEHQGADAFDTTVDFVPYSYSSAVDEDQIRYRWRERIVARGTGEQQVYWRLRVTGPARGWAVPEGDRLFERVTDRLRIEGL
jgi:eukaryotic-like serine/threonine-protein kinase